MSVSGQHSERCSQLRRSNPVHPDAFSVNEGIKEARVKLAEAQAAAEENWSTINYELSGAMDTMRAALDEADE